MRKILCFCLRRLGFHPESNIQLSAFSSAFSLRLCVKKQAWINASIRLSCPILPTSCLYPCKIIDIATINSAQLSAFSLRLRVSAFNYLLPFISRHGRPRSCGMLYHCPQILSLRLLEGQHMQRQMILFSQLNAAAMQDFSSLEDDG